MFLGRKKELEELKEQLSSKNKTTVLVYGKRRIGKSTLIKEAAKFFNGAVINHLCSKTTFEGNLELLTRSITTALELPNLQPKTLTDLFDYIKSFNKDLLLILDEYQYFKESRQEGEVDSYMQAVVDNLPANIKIIFCGSFISIMKELLQESNPLFGRFTKILHIDEMDYLEASLFYPELPSREKIRFFSVFGGSPYVLSNIDVNITLDDNIKKLIIDQNSLLRIHIESIMLREIQKNYDTRILEIIGNGKRKYGEIQNSLGSPQTGLLDKQLKALLSMETIKKTFPINRPNDKKKQFYEIKDNLMRFYFTYIFSYESLISKFGSTAYFNLKIEDSLNTFISLRFEEIIMQYFSRLVKSGKLTNIKDFGSYWFDDKTSGTNGQFDCVLHTNQGYEFYEVKFYKTHMKLKECEEEEKQIKSINGLNVSRVGFVCSAGFDFTSEKYKLVTADDVYSALL